MALLEPDDRPDQDSSNSTELDPDQLHQVYNMAMPGFSQDVELTPEQHFTLCSTALLIDRMSRDQLIQFSKLLHTTMLQQKNYYNYFVGVKWGVIEK
jgi:hypothetical protein